MKKENHNQFVRCVENIQDLSGQEHYDYGIILGGGMFSRRDIEYRPKARKLKYRVFSYVDDTTYYMTEKELLAGIIGEAMQKRALIAEIE